MDYSEATGSCYGLTPQTDNFDNILNICAAWAPGVHLVDISGQTENLVCCGYLNSTGEYLKLITIMNLYVVKQQYCQRLIEEIQVSYTPKEQRKNKIFLYRNSKYPLRM